MKKYLFLSLAATVLLISSCGSNQTKTFKTDYFAIDIDSRGYIVGMHDLTRQNRNFSPADQPSPLLSLYDSKQKRTLYPQKARYSNNEYQLEYENGSVATVGLDQKDKYFKLTLKSVEPRHDIQGVQWGNYYTNINNLFGDVIGVARDTSASVNYAIGALALDDNTIGGESRYTSEAGGGFGYVAHSADPVNNPLPVTLHEGMQFTIGGDGHSDVAFYNRREPYYRIIYGSTAGIDNNGRVNIRYHSRDRRKGGMIYSPEGAPVMVNNEPNHLMRQAVPGLDFVGSSIALWGSPDSLALMDVIQDIVLKEGLPYPTFQGKWVKDPTSFRPDVTTYGGLYDSIASYTKQMGLSVILAYDQGFLRPNRANGGYLDGKDYANKSFRLTGGNLSHREYADLLAKDGLILGRTNITTSLAPGTQDANPPSDSICIQHRRFLTQNLSATDTLIYIDDATHMEEIACWEGHTPELNMVRIGKELIHYLGVSTTKPYRLLNVTRGYWNTTPASYTAGAAVDKLQVTVVWGYQGLVPNLELQDEIARYYGDVAAYNGLGLYDFDGQEFLFHSGFGTYSVKRFFRNMFDQAKKHNLADIRFTGATLSEGSWHYQSIWNVGGGKNIYDVEKRVWGSATSQGKDLRDVNFANFFPSSFGVNFPITEKSTVEQYEHIQATAVGYQTTYMLSIGQKDVESCPQKYAIFNVIRTWEEARRADAFPTHIRKMLQNPALSWRLETMPDTKGWILYQMVDGQKGQSYNLYAKN